MKNILIDEKEYVASFDVDAQKTFTPLCPDELPAPGGTEIVDELNLQAHYAQYRLGSKEGHSPDAIWVADDEHPPLSPIEGENVDVRWAVHAVPGTLGFESLDGLPKITDYDFFVWKGVELDMHAFGSCYHDFAEKMSTGVIEFLHHRKITTVIVGGLVTDYCVKHTALQLSKAGFKVVVNLGACAGHADDTVQTALKEMRQVGIVMVDSAEQLKHKA